MAMDKIENRRLRGKQNFAMDLIIEFEKWCYYLVGGNGSQGFDEDDNKSDQEQIVDEYEATSMWLDSNLLMTNELKHGKRTLTMKIPCRMIENKRFAHSGAHSDGSDLE